MVSARFSRLRLDAGLVDHPANRRELPSAMGGSLASTSTMALVTPNPDSDARTCSTVCTLACLGRGLWNGPSRKHARLGPGSPRDCRDRRGERDPRVGRRGQQGHGDLVSAVQADAGKSAGLASVCCCNTARIKQRPGNRWQGQRPPAAGLSSSTVMSRPGALALQLVDRDRLRGVIRRRIGPARRRNRLVTGVVVRPVFLVQPPMRCRLFLVAQLRVDERKIVVRGQVFGS